MTHTRVRLPVPSEIFDQIARIIQMRDQSDRVQLHPPAIDLSDVALVRSSGPPTSASSSEWCTACGGYQYLVRPDGTRIHCHVCHLEEKPT